VGDVSSRLIESWLCIEVLLRLGCCSDEESYCELVGIDSVLQSGRRPSELQKCIRHFCSEGYLA